MRNVNVPYTIKIYCSLCKMKIALLSTFSSLTGYLLVHHTLGRETLFLAAGVFLVACGACALNQYQERNFDILMVRTKYRPLPAGKVTPRSAIALSLSLAIAGLSVLGIVFGWEVFAMALFTTFWYNGVYTYLKRKSAFAVVPGALIGAASPAIGWVAGGGTLLDFRIWVVSFFVFMWQMPHFWLLLLEHSEEYRNAGLPALGRFSRKQVERVISQWLFTTALSCQLLSLFVVSSVYTKSLLLSLSFLFVLPASGLLSEKMRSSMSAFRIINIVFFAALLVLFSEGVSEIFRAPVEKIMTQL